MIKNLSHALLGAVAFFALGWLVIQPAQVTWMTHHKDAHYALAGALVVLALFALVSLVKAFRPAKEKTARPAYSFAGSGRGRRR
jgi:hypothetical protein